MPRPRLGRWPRNHSRVRARIWVIIMLGLEYVSKSHAQVTAQAALTLIFRPNLPLTAYRDIPLPIYIAPAICCYCFTANTSPIAIPDPNSTCCPRKESESGGG